MQHSVWSDWKQFVAVKPLRHVRFYSGLTCGYLRFLQDLYHVPKLYTQLRSNYSPFFFFLRILWLHFIVIYRMKKLHYDPKLWSNLAVELASHCFYNHDSPCECTFILWGLSSCVATLIWWRVSGHDIGSLLKIFIRKTLSASGTLWNWGGDSYRSKGLMTSE